MPPLRPPRTRTRCRLRERGVQSRKVLAATRGSPVHRGYEHYICLARGIIIYLFLRQLVLHEEFEVVLLVLLDLMEARERDGHKKYPGLGHLIAITPYSCLRSLALLNML